MNDRDTKTVKLGIGSETESQKAKRILSSLSLEGRRMPVRYKDLEGGYAVCRSHAS